LSVHIQSGKDWAVRAWTETSTRKRGPRSQHIVG
jgi:hypothetical protein